MAYTPKFSTLWILPGREGTRTTLEIMRDLALRDRHQAEIRQLANYLGHPPGIDGFMRDVWRVKPDPADVEYIASPVHQARLFSQFNYLAGDCDDASTLALYTGCNTYAA
jgi:hypothetical protein